MVRKKMKRICSAACAALVLALCVVPVLLMSADAMFVEPETDGDLNYWDPMIYRWRIPLDVFTNEVHGISIDNPLVSVGVTDCVNQPFNIETPFLEDSPNFVGEPLGRWHFEVNYLKQFSDTRYFASYAIQVDSSTNYNSFTLSASKPFVASAADIFNFYHNFVFVLQPGYTVDAVISFDYSVPVLVKEYGWELEKNEFKQSVKAFNAYGHSTEESLFHNFDIELFDFPYTSENVSKLLIIENMRVHFEVFNPYDNFIDPGSENFVSATMQQFSFPVEDPGLFSTFEEFYTNYPGRRVIVSSSPGSNVFDLVEGLKSAVGGFMETEIIPGLSFGGMLATGIGISLVFVFIKIFGG